jgi:chromosome segregation ATPase
MHKEYLSIIDEDKVNEVSQKIEILEQKINEAENKLEKMKVRKQRIVTLYTDGITDTATYNQAMNKYNADVLTNKAELDSLLEQLEIAKDTIKYLNNPVTDITISSDADKKAIVNKHIKELYIERVGSATKIVVNGISYLYNSRKNKKPTLL